MSEQTLVLIKPDAVARGLVGNVLARYEAKGLTIDAMDLRRVTPELADQHYAEHVDQGWYPALRTFITSAPLVVLVLSGERAIEAVRMINGATDSVAATPGTVRGDLSLSKSQNVVHASDSPASAAREVALWFPQLGAAE